MSEISEEEIRRRAYAIWESQGRPAGSHEDHWAQALDELKSEGGAVAGNATKSPANAPPLSVVSSSTPTTRKRGKVA